MGYEYFIYKIVDPATGDPFYVGQTRNLKARINHHMSSKQPVGAKIREIRKNGLRPLFVVIDQCEYKMVGLREKFWISKFISQGYKLYNVSKNTKPLFELKYEIQIKI